MDYTRYTYIESSCGCGNDEIWFSFCGGRSIPRADLYVDGEDLNEEELERRRNTDISEIKEKIDWEYVKCCGPESEGFEDAFWQSMYDECPDSDIIEELKKDQQFEKLPLMSEQELKDFVCEYVEKIFSHSIVTTYIDEVDVTEFVGNYEGEWDDMITDQIANSVFCELKKLLK